MKDVLVLPEIKTEEIRSDTLFVTLETPNSKQACLYTLDSIAKAVLAQVLRNLPSGSIKIGDLDPGILELMQALASQAKALPAPTPTPIPTPTPTPTGIVTPTKPLEPNQIPGIPTETVPRTAPRRTVLPEPSKEVLNKIVRVSATPRVNPPTTVTAPVLHVPGNNRELSVIEKDRELLFRFVEPVDDGGSPIIRHWVAIHPTSEIVEPEDIEWIDIGLSRSYKFQSLDNTIEYLLYTRPENAIGFGYAQTIEAQPTAAAPATNTVKATLKTFGNLIYTYNPNTRRFSGKNFELHLEDAITGLSKEDFEVNNLVIRHLSDQRGTAITGAGGNTALSDLFFITIIPFADEVVASPDYSGGDVTIKLPAGVATSEDNRGNAESNTLTFKYMDYDQLIPPNASELVITAGNNELTIEWKKDNDPRIDGHIFSIIELPDSFIVGTSDPREFIYTRYGVSSAGFSQFGGAGESVGENRQRFVGLKNGTAYAIEVIPYNEFGWQETRPIAVGVPKLSASNLAVPAEALPSPMRNLSSFLTVNGDFLVRWKAPLKSNYTGFRVRTNENEWVVLGRDVREYTFTDRGINTYEFQSINERGNSESVFIREQFIGGVAPNLQGFSLEAGNRIIKVNYDPIAQPEGIDLNRFGYSTAFQSAFKIVGGKYASDNAYLAWGSDGAPLYFLNLKNNTTYEVSGRVGMSFVSGGSGNNFPSPAQMLSATPSDSYAANNAPGACAVAITEGANQLTLAITPPGDDGGGHGIGQYQVEISPIPLDSRGFPVFTGFFHIDKNLSSPTLTIDRLESGVQYTTKTTPINYNGTFGQYIENPRIEWLKGPVTTETGTPT